MKSLISLWSVLAGEMASRCSTSTTLDVKTVQVRTKHEGLSFLTITLPSFGQDFQSCLDEGMVPDGAFPSFKKVGSCLPSFLRGFTQAVFDSGTGVLLDYPSIEAIYAIRQLTLIFGKILLPCSPERERKVMRDYVQCDTEVKENAALLFESDYSDFERMAGVLFGPLFSKVDRDIYDGNIVPKHGPGATAERLTSNGKYLNRYWTDRLEKVFHVGDFLYNNSRFIDGCYDDVDFREPGTEMPSRVVSVPKTQKGPRVIAIEPASLQYVQQGLLESITRATSSCIVDEFIGSESQVPNQQLAQEGSNTGSLATLDLSEASDRVSSELVHRLLARHPLTHEAVFACRSERASVPGNGIISLSKFASMGSALCFPVEAMVFFTIICLAIEKEQGHRFTSHKDLIPLVGAVRVYGDDIIVPVDYVHTVVHYLEHFGARVGAHKSFWTGRFRESCGKEYYEGHDVSIVKVRRIVPNRRQQVAEVVSLVSFRNQLYQAGCWVTVRYLDELIGKILPYFPCVLPTSQALGRWSFLGYSPERECEHLHAPLVKAYVMSSKSPRDHLDGEGALLKYFLKRGVEPVFDAEHLKRAGRPRIAYIKPRWVSPF